MLVIYQVYDSTEECYLHGFSDSSLFPDAVCVY